MIGDFYFYFDLTVVCVFMCLFYFLQVEMASKQSAKLKKTGHRYLL